ncbi:MAG: hypothetical protein LBJ31_02640 [Treponema sp.]|nr:hypothetical protein [Treponema sp.]
MKIPPKTHAKIIESDAGSDVLALITDDRDRVILVVFGRGNNNIYDANRWTASYYAFLEENGYAFFQKYDIGILFKKGSNYALINYPLEQEGGSFVSQLLFLKDTKVLQQ